MVSLYGPARIELAHSIAPRHAGEQGHAPTVLNERMADLPVHPVSVPVALQAGRIDQENAARGVRLALSDLLIGRQGIGSVPNAKRFVEGAGRLW